jgi:DNA ligase-1
MIFEDFRPMLAPPNSPISDPDFFRRLKFPLLVSPKLDGIRAFCHNHSLYSRHKKLIPSLQAQALFADLCGFDGELIEGNATDPDVYNRTQSFVMSGNKDGDLHFYAFDFVGEGFELVHEAFEDRLEVLREFIPARPNVHVVEQKLATSLADLLEAEQHFLKLGFEGAMIKSPHGRYKLNRATARENTFFKLKRFVDDEGLLVEVCEGDRNNNAPKTNELGLQERSSSKEGKEGADTAGTLICLFQGELINVAPGMFTHAQRKAIWEQRDSLCEKIHVKFRHMLHGAKDAPRYARALGFREKWDF